MALKDKAITKEDSYRPRQAKINLQASQLSDFESEIAKVKILEAAYEQIRLTRPNLDIGESLQFGLSFGLDW